jgi:hypothetical protein
MIETPQAQGMRIQSRKPMVRVMQCLAAALWELQQWQAQAS